MVLHPAFRMQLLCVHWRVILTVHTASDRKLGVAWLGFVNMCPDHYMVFWMRPRLPAVFGTSARIEQILT